MTNFSLSHKENTACPKKMYLTLTLCFEIVITLMLGILSLPFSPYMHDSFDTLLICFHGLMDVWQ